jgi:hypothetical protein
MATNKMALPVSVRTSMFEGGVTVRVVGCGGNGSRVVPLLVQTLPHGSNIVLSDPDVVEPKNLVRQPFLPRHVGMPKVAVMLERYQTEAARRGIEMVGWQKPVNEVPRGYGPQITLGCVDNNATRAFLWSQLVRSGDEYADVYIDAGNELRHGQVVLNFKNVMMLPNSPDELAYATNLLTFPEVFPEMIEEGAEVERPVESCGTLVLDSQTLQVNVMAAAWMTAMVAWLVDGLPFSVAAVRFSTIGAHLPIPMLTKTVRRNYYNEIIGYTLSTRLGS